MNKPKAIKICGLSTREAIDAAIEGGASHIGLNFFALSPRYVPTDEAEQLSAWAGDRIKKVAVIVDADDDLLDDIVSRVKPDMLQFHGAETPERIKQIQERYGLPIMKAIPLRESFDLEAANAYVNVADWLLFDAKPPAGSELPGGNGVAFDWKILSGHDAGLPYMLSGGLNIDNVEKAIMQSGATAIDLASGVEREPGVKDPAMIQKLLAQLSRSEQKKAVS